MATFRVRRTGLRYAGVHLSGIGIKVVKSGPGHRIDPLTAKKLWLGFHRFSSFKYAGRRCAAAHICETSLPLLLPFPTT